MPVPNNIFQLSENKSKIQNFLNQYLNFGGLVETFNLTNEQKVSYQETLTEKIIINDVLKRFNLKYPDVLKSVSQFLQTNVGNVTSTRNITKWIRNLGEEKKLDSKTVQIYIEYLEKTYLIHKVKKFSYKTKEIFSTQNKYYFVDNLFSQKSDMEDQIENVVFQHFSRKNIKDIYYGRDERGHEIDFVIANQLQALQVCYQLNDTNVIRETKSLNLFNKLNIKSTHSLYLVYMYDQRAQKLYLPNIKLTSLDQLLLDI